MILKKTAIKVKKGMQCEHLSGRIVCRKRSWLSTLICLGKVCWFAYFLYINYFIFDNKPEARNGINNCINIYFCHRVQKQCIVACVSVVFRNISYLAVTKLSGSLPVFVYSAWHRHLSLVTTSPIGARGVTS